MTGDGDPRGAGRDFPGTRLSLLGRIRQDDPQARRAAWDALIRAYWRPAYAYARLRLRLPAADAEDLIQSFFARALEKDLFHAFDARRARFSSFLRLCLDGHAANEWRAARAAKRGGGALHLALDFRAADSALAQREPAAEVDPDLWFEREWRSDLLHRALARLAEECARRGTLTRHAMLVAVDLAGDPACRPTYQQLAERHGVTVTAVTNGLAAARRDLRRILLDLLRDATESEEEFRAELKALTGGGAP